MTQKKRKLTPKRKGVRAMVHIGRSVPKGFEELPGGIHLGKGIWILKMRPLPPKKILRGKKNSIPVVRRTINGERP